MALLAWNDAYSVKVRQFDDQHKKLIEIVNKLHDAMKEGRGSQVMGDVFKSIATYTQKHFADEERLMKQHGFPDYEKHKMGHYRLVMQVVDIQELAAGRTPIPQNVMNFLKDWLVNRIQGEDKKYGPYLNGKGIA